MNLNILRRRDADLRGDIARVARERAAIGDAVVAENRPITDEERVVFVAKGQELDALRVKLDDNTDLLQAAEAAAEAERNYRAEDDEPDDDALAAQRGRQSAGMPRVQMGEDRRTKAPGYFGRQLFAVQSAAYAMKEGRSLTPAEDELLKPMRAAATGLNQDVPSEGGFLVPPERSSTILQRAYEAGAILSRVTKLPIGPNTNGLSIPAIDETSRANGSRYGGIVSTWVGSGTSVTSGKPKFRQLDLKLRKCMATVYATDELMADAVALEGWIARYLPLELQFRAEDAIVNGTGSTQPLGLLNSGAVISVTRSTTDKIVLEDVQAMNRRMWAPSRLNSVWLIEQSVESELENMHLVIGTGGAVTPAYKPAGTLPGQTMATLYGRPVLPVEYCAALATVGDIINVDLSQYVVIDRDGVDQAVSLHVAFLTDEAVWRFIYRIDGQLTWNSALTTKAGAETVSCALTLSTDT